MLSTESIPTAEQSLTSMRATPITLKALEFTGSGSAYFRIWIVNVLLILLTLGLYFPWAKVRRLRYFMGSTQFDGDSLGFHGDPWRMARGYLFMGVLFGLYSVAGKISPTAGFLALLVVAGLWPALLKSSMQFRLANTSWRGLRFRFTGSLPGAYRAAMPAFVPVLVLAGMLLAVPNPKAPPQWYALVALAVAASTLAVLPLLFWNFKQYQHNHYALGSLQTTFKATPGSFYRAFFAIVGFTVLLLTVTLALSAGIGYGIQLQSGGREYPMGKVIAFVGSVVFFLGFAAMMISIKPYAITRFQNLIWTQTGNSSLRFVSTLRFRSLMWITVKNWLLIVCTLGLYWPFAAIAVMRARVQAISIKTRVDLHDLVSLTQTAQGDAAGDAAGDVFGLDIGF